MRTLLLIPSVLKEGIEGAVAADEHPRMDYDALAQVLSQGPQNNADLVGYGELRQNRQLLVRLVRRFLGEDAALALLGYQQHGAYDAIFTNGENVSLPLALVLRGRHRPAHVTIGHRLSTGKKRLFFRDFHLDRNLDRIFVYASLQKTIAEKQLGIPATKLSLIAFHADTAFYRPLPDVIVDPNQICAAGLEWRDYPTLIEAVETMPDVQVKLAAASPWSKHADQTANRQLPSNVDARRYEYKDLRELYARSAFVVVPLYENDFQAGVTTLLEAMAMQKAVIVTQTSGQTDVITDGVNGLTVAPGDVEGWRRAITRLRNDHALRETLGRNARAWVEKHATLECWVTAIVDALRHGPTRYNGKTQ